MQKEEVSGLKCERTFLALLITKLSEKHSIYNFYTKLICFIWKSDLVPLLSTKAQFICNAIQKSYFLIRFLLSTYLVKSVCLFVCLFVLLVTKEILYSHHSIIRPVRWAESAVLAMYCRFGYRTVRLIEL